MSWPASKDRNVAKKKSVGISQRASGSPTQIWKSRLSWRITLAVFLTILTVQVGIMSVTIEAERQGLLNQVMQEGSAAIAPLMTKGMAPMGELPYNIKQMEELIALDYTRVKGISIYSKVDGSFLKAHGLPTVIKITEDKNTGLPVLPAHNYSSDGNYYDVLLKPTMLGGSSYYVIAKLDSSDVEEQVDAFIEQTILIMLLMSAFVTTVLMIALGHWLLEPILFMRQNLVSASDNPENPNLKDSPFDPGDEIAHQKRC
jgi:hypothetical protein